MCLWLLFVRINEGGDPRSKMVTVYRVPLMWNHCVLLLNTVETWLAIRVILEKNLIPSAQL